MFKKDIRYVNHKQVGKKETNPVSSSLEVNFGEKKQLGRSQMPRHHHNAAFTFERLVFAVIKNKNLNKTNSTSQKIESLLLKGLTLSKHCTSSFSFQENFIRKFW